MATHITRFSTQTAYNTYINGNNIILPNVSTCEDNKETYYNPYIKNYGHQGDDADDEVIE